MQEEPEAAQRSAPRTGQPGQPAAASPGAQSETWGTALMDARRCLARWGDAFTRGERDDLAQEAALSLWRYVRARPTAPPLGAVVRTVARRTRLRALHLAFRGVRVAESDAALWPAPGEAGPQCLRVEGALVPVEWLLPRLERALSRLRPTNRLIVLAFYGGCSCAELAARFRLTEEAVKVRLH